MRLYILWVEVEDEFKVLCLEFLQFGYDVFSELIFIFSCGGCLGMILIWFVVRVFDDKFKKECNEKMYLVMGSGWK